MEYCEKCGFLKTQCMCEDDSIKTVRCHYNFLEEYCNKIGRKHIISITSCFGEQHGEHFFTLVYDTPDLRLKDC